MEERGCPFAINHQPSTQLAPEVGIAPTSPRLQRGANLPQLLRVPLRAGLRRDKIWLAEPKLEERRLVVPRGNAPRSSGYQPGALLLSYGTEINWSDGVLG